MRPAAALSSVANLQASTPSRCHRTSDRFEVWSTDPKLAPWPDPVERAVFQTGAWILPDERPLPVESLTAALEHSLQPKIAVRARSIATTLRTDGTKAAVARVTGNPYEALGNK